MLIHIVRGPMPEKNTLPPSSLHMRLVTATTLSLSFASISRVLRTSSGVVSPAAMPPEIDPKSALSNPVTSPAYPILPLRRKAHFFIPSHKGN